VPDFLENIYWNNLEAKNFVTLSLEEAVLVLNWRNHVNVRSWMHQADIIAPESHRNFIEKLKTDSSNFYWLVKDLLTSILLGVIYINRIDWSSKSGNFGVYKNPNLSLAGIGKQLSLFEIEIAFNQFSLNSLILEAQKENLIAISLYKKLGFVPTNETADFIWMKLTKHE
jgi:UDP-4-amino-4,6-dideoxy-N-acetyl-beta-L-altrosamine N-acetyltransferase